MSYRSVAKWEIDIGETQETQGLARMFGSLYRQEFGIKFRNQETRFTVKTSDLMTLREIERLLPQLARIRYQHHHKHGTGNDYGRPVEDDEITATLEGFGVRLPGWLR